MIGYFILGTIALILAVYIVVRSHINNRNNINEHVTILANLLHDRIALLETKLADTHGKLDTIVENTKTLVQDKIDDEDLQINNMIAKIKSFGGSVLTQFKESKKHEDLRKNSDFCIPKLCDNDECKENGCVKKNNKVSENVA